MSRKNKLKPIIGAEIHVELNTDSKMFCGCKNDPFGAKKPNTYTCPICLGLPGALPVPNAKAIDYTIMIGLALNCKIGDTSTFDRKHYFYPDLPKGYQISQQTKPLCYDGFIETSHGKVRINRVHLEEDTAKLMHDKVDGERISLIDFNRSGVPLVEIVTEPDIHSAEQAKEMLKKIRTIIKFLEVSDADMEKGSMRLEANISLSEDESLPDYKVEVKNINSFRFYSLAIEYEIKRQSKILAEGKVPVQETRGWDEKSASTVSQRSKESAQEYGYFPEPDIPPIGISPDQVSKLKSKMPPLPENYASKLRDAGVPEEQAAALSISKDKASYALKALEFDQKGEFASEIANRIINNKLDITKIQASGLTKILQDEQSSKISDQGQLQQAIDEVISKNEQVAQDYKSGKIEALGFLMGQVMKITQGKADAQKASELLKSSLSD